MATPRPLSFLHPVALYQANALKLKASILEHHSLSDVHDLPSFDLAQRIVHEAGLASVILPLKYRKDWGLHLGIADISDHDFRAVRDADFPSEHLYALIRLQPMTDFVGDLVGCDLSRPWWAAPLTFNSLADLLAPGWKSHCSLRGGRSTWGAQRRAAFEKAFDERWSAFPDLSLEPLITLLPGRVRFASVPRTSSLLVPALAGAAA